MPNDEFGSTMSGQNAPAQVPPDDTEEDLSSGSAGVRAAPLVRRGNARRRGESQFAVGEVVGDEVPLPTVDTETAPQVGADDDEVPSPGTETGEEYVEATPDQLAAAAESGEETAVSDLRGIGGFEEREAAEEGAAVSESDPRDAGEALEGGQGEFFPILAALAPTLISTIGPAVAKGVMNRLSPRAKRVIQHLPRHLPAVKAVVGGVTGAGGISTAVKGVVSAVKGAGGTSSVLTLVAKLLQQAQAMPGGEGGIEVEEAFVEQAAAAIEVIIGTDDRVRINQTTQVPWRRLCALRIHFPSGATYRGTGFLIGPRALATAGHCVYLHNQGGWARRVEVIPGCNGSQRPFGQAESTSFRSVRGWVSGRKPESDYGCVVLPAGAFGGRNLGSFGFAAFDAPVLLARPAVLAGYPGDKPFAEMWGMARRIKAVTAKKLVYDIDTMGGQSGAPVYIKRNGQRHVVGIHNYGLATGNSATRVTQAVYQRLFAWSKI